jgi:hypothetical protein
MEHLASIDFADIFGVKGNASYCGPVAINRFDLVCSSIRIYVNNRPYITSVQARGRSIAI